MALFALVYYTFYILILDIYTMFLKSDLLLEVSTLIHTTHAHNTNLILLIIILLMNSCNTDIFLATTSICSLSALKCMHLITFHFLLKGLSCYQLITQQFPYFVNVQCSTLSGRKFQFFLLYHQRCKFTPLQISKVWLMPV